MKEDFSFSSTYLRTIEKHLLDQTDIDRMVGAKNADEAFKVLENTNYSREYRDSISEMEVKDYRKILKTDLQKGRGLLFSLTRESSLIKLILLPFDIHNIKVFFKACLPVGKEKFFNEELDRFISSHGSQNPEELKRAVRGERADIAPEFQRVVKEVEAGDPAHIDIYLDKKSWELSLKFAEELKSPFIAELIRKKIDILNLRTVLRAYFLGKTDRLKNWLIEGGAIKTIFFEETVNKTPKIQEALALLEPVFPRIIRQAIELFLKNQEKGAVSSQESLSKLFKELDDIEMMDIKDSKLIPFGPEVIFCYFLAKFNANRNVRIILEGKLNGLRDEEISERVRIPF